MRVAVAVAVVIAFFFDSETREQEYVARDLDKLWPAARRLHLTGAAVIAAHRA